MKKIYSFVLLFIFTCFILPILFTVRFTAEATISKVEEKEELEIDKTYDYSNYTTIRLLHTKTNEIEEMDLDEYLCGVIAAEMPADFEEEALKAQAVVARTYTIYTIINGTKKHTDADICDSSNCCQAWISKEDRFAKWENDKEEKWNKIVKAVNETVGEVITYNKEVIDALFHSNSGGITETAANVWGGNDYPYLQSVETIGEEGYTQYSSEVSYTKEELLNKLKETYKDIEIDFNSEECIKILNLTSSGRVQTIKFGNKELAGTQARTILGLKSTNFIFNIENQNIIFSVIGYRSRSTE